MEIPVLRQQLQVSWAGRWLVLAGAGGAVPSCRDGLGGGRFANRKSGDAVETTPGTFEVRVKLHPEEGRHFLAMLLARSRIETIPTTASPSITGRCRKPPKSI